MKFYAPTKISENIRETPEGFLICLGVPIARTGEMVYGPGETPIEPGPDGKVVVSRDEKEVFRPETIASFSGKAVTILHPSSDVNPSNWGELAKGTLQNVRRGSGDHENDLIADLFITDAEAIGLVKRGLREVSCGYDAEYLQESPGRGIHTNIIGNHLALVEQGRAGMSYAINDHLGEGASEMTKDQKKKSMGEKIKSIFAKAQDDALKVADEETVEETIVGDDDKKPTYDDLVKMCDALKSEVSELKKGKDEMPEGKKDEEKKPEAKDEEVSVSLEDRLKKLEMAVEKMLSAETTEEPTGDGDGEEELDDEEVADEKEPDEKEPDEEKPMTGDTAARAEILAPGIKASKNVKVEALKKAYETKDGRAAIEKLTGGKAPTFDSAPQVEMLFVAASEILKSSRTDDLAGTKKRTKDFNYGDAPGAMTPERMNEINAAKYGLKN